MKDLIKPLIKESWLDLNLKLAETQCIIDMLKLILLYQENIEMPKS